MRRHRRHDHQRRLDDLEGEWPGAAPPLTTGTTACGVSSATAPFASITDGVFEVTLTVSNL